MKEIKLKECPCCGGEAEMKETRYIDSTPSSVKVLCKKCALQTKSFAESIDYCAKEEAAKVWNRRMRCAVCDYCGSPNLKSSFCWSKDGLERTGMQCADCGKIMKIKPENLNQLLGLGGKQE